MDKTEPKELTTFDPNQLTIREMSFLANEIVQSKMFPDLTTAHQAFVKMLAGREMGITPFQAVAGIHIIQGKAVPGGGLLAAAVKGSNKYDYRVVEQTDKTCSIEFYQRQGDKLEPIGTSTFTIEDARKAGTKNLDKFPRNMLFNRAMSNGVKWYTPDATNGPVYVEGEIIEGEEERLVMPQDAPTYNEPLPVLEPEPEQVGAFDDALAAIEQDPITRPQQAKIFAVLSMEKGIKDKEAQKRIVQAMAKSEFGVEIESTSQLTKEQATDLISKLIDQDAEMLRTFFGKEEVPF